MHKNAHRSTRRYIFFIIHFGSEQASNLQTSNNHIANICAHKVLIEIQKQLSKVRLHNAIIQATQSVIACICIYLSERFILKKQFHTNPIRSDKMSMKFTHFGYSSSFFFFYFWNYLCKFLFRINDFLFTKKNRIKIDYRITWPARRLSHLCAYC